MDSTSTAVCDGPLCALIEPSQNRRAILGEVLAIFCAVSHISTLYCSPDRLSVRAEFLSIEMVVIPSQDCTNLEQKSTPALDLARMSHRLGWIRAGSGKLTKN